MSSVPVSHGLAGLTSSSRLSEPIRGAEMPAMCRTLRRSSHLNGSMPDGVSGAHLSLDGLPFSGSSLGRTMTVSPDKTAFAGQHHPLYPQVSLEP